MKNYVIGEPCAENWNEMTPAEQGKFCDVCAKCVVDLTSKSQAEIENINAENQGDLCGRMTLKQLVTAHNSSNTVSTTESEALVIKPRYLKRLQIFAAAFVAAFALLLGNAKAQTVHPQTTEVTPPSRHHVLGKIAPRTVEKGSLKGIVSIGEEPVAGVKVKVNDTKTGQQVAVTQTDEHGKYIVSGLKPGEYLVYATAYHYAYANETTTVEKGGLQIVNLKLEDLELMGDIAEPEYLEEEQNLLKPEVEPETTEELPIEVQEETPPVDEINTFKGQIIEIKPEERPCKCIEEDPGEKISPIYIQEINENEISENPVSPEIDSPETGQAEAIEETYGLSVFPNPSNGKFSLLASGWKSSSVRMLITDVNGKVLSEEIRSLKSGEISVDLSTVSQGIYFVKLTGDKSESLTKRIVIE